MKRMKQKLIALFSGFPDHHFPEDIAARLKTELTDRSHIVFVSATPSDYARTEGDSQGMHGMLAECGLAFEKISVIDGRTSCEEAAQLIRSASCIWQMGGNPTEQMKLIREKGIADEIRNSNAVLMGVSAGSMNMAKRVVDIYESLEPYEGLGLTDITLKAHFSDENCEFGGTLRTLSKKMPVWAMDDGSAIFIKDGFIERVGKIFLVTGGVVMSWKKVDKDTYYRKCVYRHFTEDCKCSTSMTVRIDVTDLVAWSKKNGSKFHINFLYLLSKVLNSRNDYKMVYLWKTDELICYDQINPAQYVFHEDTETCSPVYSVYYPDYKTFYDAALKDLEDAKKTTGYNLDAENHPNWFDASYVSWLSYDSLNVELPDGYLHFPPIINWGRYREENGRLMLPLSIRMNHAIADGYLVANVYRLLQKEIEAFVR